MKLAYHRGKVKQHRISRQRRLEKRRVKRKSRKPQRRKKSHSIHGIIKSKRNYWSNERKRFLRNFFRKRSFKGQKRTITIETPLGLEYDPDEFLKKAQEFIEHDNSSLVFDLSKCSRLWPSAVILLCSLVEWCKIVSDSDKPPRLWSIDPNDKTVHDYLSYCGFYKYVHANVMRDTQANNSHEAVVKIEKDLSEKRMFSLRFPQIRDLVREKSNFTEEQVEIFSDRILTEILNNVLEHGIGVGGWLTLVQYHRRTGIISICIADNGIGIKNTLLTGPQGLELAKKLPHAKDNDGDAIKKSFEKHISGAFMASNKEKGTLVKLSFKSEYKRGSHRGNGLLRIKSNCEKLKIPLIIISQKGAVIIDKDGIMQKPINLGRKAFAGTLYHLQIPAKDISNGDRS